MPQFRSGDMEGELMLEGVGEECLQELIQMMKDLTARVEVRTFDRSSF